MAKPQSVILTQVFWQHQMICKQKIVTIPEYRWMFFNQTHTLFTQAPHPIFFSLYLQLLKLLPNT